METNFFKSILALQIAGDWTINIAKETADRLIVSVLFYNNCIGDDARKKVPPILLKGTPQELDDGFFQAIELPIKETAQLFANMEQFLKQKEQAKITSKMEKDNTSKADRDKSDKQKQYEQAMKKVDELEADGKYREAWIKVPQAELYPEHAETIRNRRMALSKQFAPDLFNEPKIQEPC
ncbi:prtrc system protein e [Flavobacterium sp. LB2P84]|uniref:prtrc system protein e n=1 Tax=Flavobacterium yafengii TaxID=3041253 RepID=UPI0024A888A0|nr:prtrc system protein e [Flavobacterium yafengii]MDI6033294.1 prtrc system protein e [Flavobacterium yafengii]